jgi:hypothetical protein
MKMGTHRDDGMVWYSHNGVDQWLAAPEFYRTVKAEYGEACKTASRLRAAITQHDRDTAKAQRADLRKRMKEACGTKTSDRREKQRLRYWTTEGRPKALARLREIGLA